VTKAQRDGVGEDMGGLQAVSAGAWRKLRTAYRLRP
jgi:hypothetical protein